MFFVSFLGRLRLPSFRFFSRTIIVRGSLGYQQFKQLLENTGVPKKNEAR